MQNTANVQNAKLYFEPTYCEISYKYHKIAFGLLTAFKHRTDAGRSKFQTITRGTPFTKCSWDPLQAMLPRLMIIHELSFMLFSFKIEAHSLKVL